MSFVDPIGDMITRIRNAQLRALNNVTIPSSKFRARILDVLKQEGYIANYKISSENKKRESLFSIRKASSSGPLAAVSRGAAPALKCAPRARSSSSMSVPTSK